MSKVLQVVSFGKRYRLPDDEEKQAKVVSWLEKAMGEMVDLAEVKIERRMYAVQEAAEYLGVSQVRVYQIINAIEHIADTLGDVTIADNVVGFQDVAPDVEEERVEQTEIHEIPRDVTDMEKLVAKCIPGPMSLEKALLWNGVGSQLDEVLAKLETVEFTQTELEYLEWATQPYSDEELDLCDASVARVRDSVLNKLGVEVSTNWNAKYIFAWWQLEAFRAYVFGLDINVTVEKVMLEWENHRRCIDRIRNALWARLQVEGAGEKDA
jgi:hypothetical protein